MAKLLIPIIGEKFGNLTVIEDVGLIPFIGRSSSNGRGVKCLCNCGNEKLFSYSYLKSGGAKSCGCKFPKLRYSSIQNKSPHYSKILAVWLGAKRRCFTKKHKSYNHYGLRGISVCQEWANSFPAFHEWAINNGYQPGLHLDRINNDGNYEPSNCRWVTCAQNGRNKRDSIYITINGENKNMKEWAEISGVPYDRIRNRRDAGWPTERLLSPKILPTEKRCVTPKRYIRKGYKCQPIIAIDNNGNDVGEFVSVTQCAKILKLNQSSVSQVLNGSRAHTKGYTFKVKH